MPDPLYPERAYVPTLNSASSNEFSGGWTPVEDAHVGPGGGQMMEFSYRVLFPKDSSELWTENYEIVDGDLIVENAVEAQNEAFANTDYNLDTDGGGGGGLRRHRQRKLGEINHGKRNVDIGNVVFGEEASQNEDTSAAAAAAAAAALESQGEQAAQGTQATQETQGDQADTMSKSEEFVNQGAIQPQSEEAPPVTQTINWAAHGVSAPDVNWAFNGAAPSGTDWAGDPNKDANNDAGDTTNNNDGGGQLGINWASNGATVPEGTPDVFWAQNSIGVDWASKNPVPEGVPDIFWHENEVKANATAAQNNGTQSGPVPVLGDVASSSKKYILLQWHYVTARDCYQPGYDTYSWPASWGAWRPPWGGVCDGDEGQTQYYNCAEVMILGPGAYSPPSQAPTGVPELEKLTTSVSPKAVSDLVLVGVSDMAYMNVLQNDVDPDGDDLVIGEVTQPEHGKIEIMEDGIVLVYRPDPDFTGVDCE